MKNLFIVLLVVLAAGCSQDTSELKNNVLKAYNSDAPQGAKATDLMIIQKKGNEYVGLLTTENDMQLMLSVFSDGKEFFYWVYREIQPPVIMDNENFNDTDTQSQENNGENSSIILFSNDMGGKYIMEKQHDNIFNCYYQYMNHTKLIDLKDVVVEFRNNTIDYIKFYDNGNHIYNNDTKELGVYNPETDDFDYYRLESIK